MLSATLIERLSSENCISHRPHRAMPTFPVMHRTAGSWAGSPACPPAPLVLTLAFPRRPPVHAQCPLATRTGLREGRGLRAIVTPIGCRVVGGPWLREPGGHISNRGWGGGGGRGGCDGEGCTRQAWRRRGRPGSVSGVRGRARRSGDGVGGGRGRGGAAAAVSEVAAGRRSRGQRSGASGCAQRWDARSG